MEQITSAQNSKIKNANKLKKKRERDKTGLALVEGIHLIEEAYQSQIEVIQLFIVDTDRMSSSIIDYAKEVYQINLKVAEALSGTVTPQGFFAIIKKGKFRRCIPDRSNTKTRIHTDTAVFLVFPGLGNSRGIFFLSFSFVNADF